MTIRFFTQNNGTLISASEAKRLPILTYLSGPINSLTGAAFLSQREGPFEKDVIVVDVGGTTTDTCVLQPTGLPRPAAAFSSLSGARTNFSVPDLRSVGLGGGSLVHVDQDTGNVTIGPDSVGYELESRSQIFGGSDLTVTDVVSTTKRGSSIRKHITKAYSGGSIEIASDVVDKVEKEIARLLATVIDEVKTEAGLVDIILVGGGIHLVPETIHGVEKILRPSYGHVANAIGAAMARVSHKIDQIVSILQTSSEAQELSRQCQRTLEEASFKGILNAQIVEKRTLALSYSTTPEVRIITTAVGDAPLDIPIEQSGQNGTDDISAHNQDDKRNQDVNFSPRDSSSVIPDLAKNVKDYRPSVSSGKWQLSETDIVFISEGCGILGCGGGGDPYLSFLAALSLVQSGQSIIVVDPTSIPSDAAVPAVGFMGSPDILSERLPSGEE